LIGDKPAATAGDSCHCNGMPDNILTGSSGVLIGGKPAARMGDKTVHGGVIITGCASVLIGEIGGELDITGGFVMPTEEERVKFINETIQACIMLLRNKLNLLKKNDTATLAEFETWFGNADEGAKQIIIHRIERELNLFESLNEQDFEELQDEFLRRKTYAMVSPEDKRHNIFWGDKFWSRERMDERSRVTVLVHEVSHFLDIGNTCDFDYGIEKCQGLAKKHPGKALHNADTFAFFIEAKY
jgi:hypothetical protein